MAERQQTPRMTASTVAILTAFLADPDRAHYGLQLGARAALASGTVHPILARLEGVGWVSSGWEDVDPREAGRPARRYYRLAPEGFRAASAAVARAEANRARLTARLRPAEGMS